MTTFTSSERGRRHIKHAVNILHAFILAIFSRGLVVGHIERCNPIIVHSIGLLSHPHIQADILQLSFRET